MRTKVEDDVSNSKNSVRLLIEESVGMALPLVKKDYEVARYLFEKRYRDEPTLAVTFIKDNSDSSAKNYFCGNCGARINDPIDVTNYCCRCGYLFQKNV